MNASIFTSTIPSRSSLWLWWLTLALFLSYLAVAMPLPVISLYATGALGRDATLAGLAAGLPFAATILTRLRAGRLADGRGGKPCMLAGLLVYALASLVCLASTWPALSHGVAFGVLLAGRLLLGLGESLATVGMLGWGIALVGGAQAGRFLAVMGMGMYGSFALGAPLGLALYRHAGFAGPMLAGIALPLLGLAMVCGLPARAGHDGARAPLRQVLRQIGMPGLVVGLQGVGFAVIGAFMSLYFVERGWPHAWLGLSLFAAGFVAARLAGGHLPDRLGGVPVALAALLVEAAGQGLLWLAPVPSLALLGALVTGLGCSLVFPSMGAEVVRRVPPPLRATAMGGFAAFQDLAYAATAPVAGWIADRHGLPAVFLLGTLAALAGWCVTLALRRRVQAA
jgi:MFS family permease